MSDIRIRKGKSGITYQVRYLASSAASGYSYATFKTRKEAQDFIESGRAKAQSSQRPQSGMSVTDATEKWLRICEKEGLNGREPVTRYTLQNYRYRARFIKSYKWPAGLAAIMPPDVVAFRSYLLRGDVSRETASKVLSTLHSVFKEMAVRGLVASNPAAGICVRQDSRYKEPVSIPTRQDIMALLRAADALASDKNRKIARAWTRYRPLLYLAVDSGMRPQEYLALSHGALRERGVYVDRAISGCGREISVTKTPVGRRFIDLSAETLDLLNHYAEHHSTENPHDLVFPAENGSWLCRRNWQRRGFDIACEKAGLVHSSTNEKGQKGTRSKYRPYDLRHFFASMLIDRETNLKKIQTLMGHTNIEQTLNVYGHLIEEKEDSKAPRQGMLSALSQSSCGKFVAEVL